MEQQVKRVPYGVADFVSVIILFVLVYVVFGGIHRFIMHSAFIIMHYEFCIVNYFDVAKVQRIFRLYKL